MLDHKRRRDFVKHHFENHDLVTERSSQLVDVTDEVRAAVERADITNGMALVYSPHTTCAVVINEHESGFIEDFNELLADLAPEQGRYYRHDDLAIRT
jgi:secondary thiamine-phosphate synthase enzyme